MPTYGYRCDSCGNEFDLRQSFHDEPKADCPRCKNAAQRLFHAPPVIYKGSGFYTTDYARKSGSSSSSSDKSSSDKSGSEKSSSEKSSSTASSEKSSTSSSSEKTSSSGPAPSTPAKTSTSSD